MNLDQYLSRSGAPSMAAFAQSLGKNEAQMRQYRHGYNDRRSPPELCVLMERETGGAIRCEDERPDLHWLRVKDPRWTCHPKGRPALDIALSA
jgi:DNA-binding transcriptional regulator YdaS (Cro superfamily)